MTNLNRVGILLCGALLLPRLATAQEAPREVPSFELEQPTLTASLPASASLLAGVTDFGASMVEGAQMVGVFFAGTWAMDAMAGLTLNVGFVNAAYGFGAAMASLIALGAPLGDAFLLSHVGNSGRTRHPLAPLAVTTYVSHLLVDALSVALLCAGSVGASLAAYLVGSAVGSSAVTLVHGATAQVVPQAAPALEETALSPAPQGPAVPTSLSPGYTVRF